MHLGGGMLNKFLIYSMMVTLTACSSNSTLRRGIASTLDCRDALNSFSNKKKSKDIFNIKKKYSKTNEDHFITAKAIVSDNLNIIKNNTKLNIPKNIEISTTSFEYTIDGILNIMVEHENYENTKELLPGIYHEIGHLVSSENRFSKGVKIRDYLIEHDKKMRDIDRKLLDVMIEQDDTEILERRDQLETLKKALREELMKEKAKVPIITNKRYIEEDELFADLFAVILTEDPKAIEGYLKQKYIQHSEEFFMSKLAEQRGLDYLSHNKIIYYNGSSIEDDVYTSFLPFKNHIYKNYILKNNFSEIKFKLLEALNSSIRETNIKGNNFYEKNIYLIKKIDSMMGNKYELPDFNEFEIKSIKMLVE